MKKRHWDCNMKLDRIETFCAVARNMSFSKAAEECHVAQSAISQQIRAMEEELGFPLFVRSTRKVSFTDAGQSFYVDCVRLLAGFDEAIDRATSAQTARKSVLTIGIEGVVQLKTRAEIIKKFSRLYPDIIVRPTQIDRDSKYEDMLTGKIDVVFDISQYYTLNQRLRKCGAVSNRHCLMVCRDHPLASRKSVSKAELAEYVTFWGGIPRVEDYVIKCYMEYFRDSGIEAPNVICVPEQDVANFMVAINQGGNIVPCTEIDNWNQEHYSFVELEEPLILESAWIYAAGNGNPALMKFVEMVQEEEKEKSWKAPVLKYEQER